MDYMTISEAATKWNLSNRRIQTLCSQGRIPGAERAGYCWLLPKDLELYRILTTKLNEISEGTQK